MDLKLPRFHRKWLGFHRGGYPIAPVRPLTIKDGTLFAPGAFARTRAHLTVAARLALEARNRKRMPAWWSCFGEAYELWQHNGTCGGEIDDEWIAEHWPSLRRPLVFVPMITISAAVDKFCAACDELTVRILELSKLPAVALPDSCQPEFFEIRPRNLGSRLRQAAYLEAHPDCLVVTPKKKESDDDDDFGQGPLVSIIEKRTSGEPEVDPSEFNPMWPAKHEGGE